MNETGRRLSAACTLSLARDVAVHVMAGRECPPSLNAELESCDGLTRSRIEFFVLGAGFVNQAEVVEVAVPAEQATPEPIAADWQTRLAEIERGYVVRQRWLMAIAAVCLALVLGFARVSNQRAANDADMARVTQ